MNELEDILADTSTVLEDILADTSTDLEDILADTSNELEEILTDTSTELEEILGDTLTELEEILADTLTHPEPISAARLTINIMVLYQWQNISQSRMDRRHSGLGFFPNLKETTCLSPHFLIRTFLGVLEHIPAGFEWLHIMCSLGTQPSKDKI